MYVYNLVQGTVAKTIPKKKKCNKAKWLSEEVLQIAEKRREVKRKGEKERWMGEKERKDSDGCPSECRVPKNSKER